MANGCRFPFFFSRLKDGPPGSPGHCGSACVRCAASTPTAEALDDRVASRPVTAEPAPGTPQSAPVFALAAS